MMSTPDKATNATPAFVLFGASVLAGFLGLVMTTNGGVLGLLLVTACPVLLIASGFLLLRRGWKHPPEQLCAQCGYDLQGLAKTSLRCPECGLPRPISDRPLPLLPRTGLQISGAVLLTIGLLGVVSCGMVYFLFIAIDVGVIMP
jgi:hypothetical protein